MIDIMVGPLFSEKQSFLFDYYSLDWCASQWGPSFDPALRGVTLTGSPQKHSPFDHKFGYDRNIQMCKKTYTNQEVQAFSAKIQLGYHYRLYLDDLPSASILRDKQNKE